MANNEIKTILTFVHQSKGDKAQETQLKRISKLLENIKDVDKLKEVAATYDVWSRKAANVARNLEKINTQLTTQLQLVDKIGAAGGTVPPGVVPPSGGGGGGGGGKPRGKGAGDRGGLLRSVFGQYGFLSGFSYGTGGHRFGIGPGRLESAAGQMLGGAVGSVFTGAAGISRGLSGIPGVGGFLAGQFEALGGAAKEAAEFQTTAADLLRFRETSTGVFGARRGEIRAESDRLAREAPIEERGALSRMFREQRLREILKQPALGARAQRRGMTRQQEIVDEGISSLADIARGGEPYGIGVGRQIGLMRGAAQQMPFDLFDPHTKAAMQLVAPAARLGIAPEKVGDVAALLARGGFVGLQKPEQGEHLRPMTAALLTEATAQGFQLGLRNIQLDRFVDVYLNQASRAQLEGSTVSPTALFGATGGLLMRSGAPVQSANIAASMLEGGRRIGTQGPQGLDFLLMRHFGGLGEGPISPDAMLEARRKMFTGEGFTAQNIQRFMFNVSKSGGGGAAGGMLLNALMQGKLGAGFTPDVLQTVAKGTFPGIDTILQNQAAANDMRNVGMERRALATVPSFAAQEAELQNRRIADAGNDLIQTFKNLDAVQTNTLTATASMSEALTILSKTILWISKQITLESNFGPMLPGTVPGHQRVLP